MGLNRLSLYISTAWLVILLVGAITIVQFGPNPLAIDLNSRLLSPRLVHWMGTDELGRSLLSRLSHAALQTISIAAMATTISIVVGGALGCIAGWYGRWPDSLINGFINFFWSIPFVLFAILILAIAGSNIWSIMLVIAAVNWVSSARILRAEMRRLRNERFIQSARSRGYSTSRIILLEVTPNLYPTAIILLGLGAAETISLETGLAYLGMSLPPPLPSWGGMMNEGLSYLSVAWWIAALPAFAIVATLASWRTLTSQIAAAMQR